MVFDITMPEEIYEQVLFAYSNLPHVFLKLQVLFNISLHSCRRKSE